MFVPDDFAVPQTLKAEKFVLHPLTIKHVEKDFEAVMSSIDHLQKQIPPEVFHGVWPDRAMTQEDDMIDLAWHQVEFRNRTSFTYTVLSPDEKTCLGCVYIFPPRFSDGDAEVFLWVRQSELASGLDGVLFNAVKEWLKNAWPFKNVTFPFRK